MTAASQTLRRERPSTAHAAVLTVALVLAAPGASAALAAQSLAARVNGASGARVQFTFTARAGVCGDGISYIQTGPNSFTGEFSDVQRMTPCVAGPVRVVLDRANREFTEIRTYVGPVSVEPDASDLGRVSSREASAYLLDLARSADGRAGRDAILPAALADSSNITPGLLAIARDQALPRVTRSSAMSWLVRTTDAAGTANTAAVLVQLARDESDNLQVRQQALRTLARLDAGAGIPQLIELTKSHNGGWLQRESLQTLAQSGDPRARDAVRAVIQRADLPDDALAGAIRGLGSEYATAKDAALLRDVYSRLPGERSRDADVSTLAQLGGAVNTQWLLATAGDANGTSNSRRMALQAAVHAGANIARLIAMYDATTDPQMKDALVNAFAQSGDRAATDELIHIAKSDDSPAARRLAISQLSRSDDPRVRDLLRSIVER